MNQASPQPGQAAALAASMNPPAPMSPDSGDTAAPSAHKPIPKVTMRVSLKAPTPGAGPATLELDPRRDIVPQSAAAPVPVATPATMAPPLNISPVLGGQFGSMNEVTSSPAPVLAHSPMAPQQAATLAQAPQQTLKKPAANRSGLLLNAICIILGLIAIILFAFMLIE